MTLPLYETFTENQLEQFGPRQTVEVIKTEVHRYATPFMYDNVEVGNFYEIDQTKGIELKAMDGYITIEEDRPIVGVNVIGSGCVPHSYNICEWWDEGESIDSMTNQLVKRQYVGNLHGTHPSIYSQLLMGTFPGITFRDVTHGDVTGPVDCLKKLSDGFYGGYFMGFYENVAHFRVGPPNPQRVTIRAGAKVMEDTGTRHERIGDYAVRVIELEVAV